MIRFGTVHGSNAQAVANKPRGAITYHHAISWGGVDLDEMQAG